MAVERDLQCARILSGNLGLEGFKCLLAQSSTGVTATSCILSGCERLGATTGGGFT
jgi:hypothetical protein